MRFRNLAFMGVSLTTLACSAAAPDWEEPTDAIAAPVTFGGCLNNCSSWVYPSAALKHLLIYVPDHEGDRIPEFARVGYKKSRYGTLKQMAGGLPPMGPRRDYTGQPPLEDVTVDVDEICDPDSRFRHGEDIQDALDDLADDPPDSSGVRGHLHLPRGHYAIWNRLVVPDRVVLAGHSENVWNGLPATTLHACGKSSAPLVRIDETGPAPSSLNAFAIVDEVVPVGSTSFVLWNASPGELQRGDRIKIVRYISQDWFEDLHMTDTWTNPPIPGGPCYNGQDPEWRIEHIGSPKSCFPGDLEFERTVTHTESIDDSHMRVFFEHPITNALEEKYGTVAVYHITHPTRANYSGVYNLRGTTHYFDETANQNDTDCPANHKCGQSQDFVVVNNAMDSWVKEVIGERFPQNTVAIAGAARQVTVEDVYSVGLDNTSGGQSYSYTLRGNMNLFVNATAENGRHDFLTQSGSSGPGAFVDCTATGARKDSGTHHDWSIGTLLDRVTLDNNITASNRHESDIDGVLPSGSGFDSHGWTGANQVIWNSTATGYEVHNPPSAQNWLIGSTGTLPAAPDTSQGESQPHYDFYEQLEHGTRVSLAPLSTETKPSLFRVSNEQWRSYRDATTGPTEFETRTYFIGDPDQTANDIGTTGDTNDQVPVSQTFLSRLTTWGFGTGGGVAGFDALGGDHNVPFTFRYQLEPGETIIGGYLALRLERGGTHGPDADHHITLASGNLANDDEKVTFYWRCTAPCNPVPSTMLGPIGGGPLLTWPTVRIIDLGFNPYLMWLNHVDANRAGELNVNLYRRARVDWASLTLIVGRP